MRHGRTEWNRAHRLQGRSDIPLDAEGRAEFEGLRPPSDWRMARIVSSPLVRAVETAETIAGGRPVETDARLVELDFGDWEGRRGADLLADPATGFRDVEHWGWEFAPPGGESLRALRARVVDFLRETAQSGEPVIAVCHINVMRVALALAHGWDFDRPAPFRIKRRRLYPLALDADGAPRPAGEPVRLVAKETTSCGS